MHGFELLESDRGYGVYRKTYRDGSERVTFIIAALPSVRAYTAPPASALAEYPNEGDALAAFECGERDPSVMQPRKKGKNQPPDPGQA